MKTFKSFIEEDTFEVGHSHDKSSRMVYSSVEAKNSKEAISKSQGKANHTLTQVFNSDKNTFHHPQTGKKMKNQFEEEFQIDEDWQKVNKADKTDGLSQKAVNAYRRENPGSKLQTAVTEKDPSGKRAARRKSFCSRMSGMKKRLTSAENARDPDSPINKALRRWRC